MDPPEDPHDGRTPHSWLDRLGESWFPPAAVIGAFAAFTAAVYRGRAAPPAAPARPPTPPELMPAAPALDLPRQYSRSAILAGGTSPHPFRRALVGVAAGNDDQIHALGDDEVRVYRTSGELIRRWPIPEGAACLATGSDDRVLVGSLGRVDIYEADGRHAGRFVSGEDDRPAAVTAIRLFGSEVLVADAAARFIRRHDSTGRQVGEIGSQSRTKGFILPNGWLDFDVDASGVVHVADPGRHRVTTWALDGTPLGFFGSFSQRDPRGFVGCCNPVNLALTPDGKVVTGEKMVARVKVYEPDGTLLAVVGPEHFDQRSTHLYLDVDSAGRILVADPKQREVKVFTWT
jgi:hypothetical protein